MWSTVLNRFSDNFANKSLHDLLFSDVIQSLSHCTELKIALISMHFFDSHVNQEWEVKIRSYVKRDMWNVHASNSRQRVHFPSPLGTLETLKYKYLKVNIYLKLYFIDYWEQLLKQYWNTCKWLCSLSHFLKLYMKLYRIEMPIMFVYIWVTFHLWTVTQIFKRELGKEIQYQVTRKINRYTKFRWPTFHLIIWNYSSIDNELNFLLILVFKLLLDLHEWIGQFAVPFSEMRKTDSTASLMADQSEKFKFWRHKFHKRSRLPIHYDHDDRLCLLLFRFTARRWSPTASCFCWFNDQQFETV